MSQFRLTGAYYVSEWNGDPLNIGTDPLLPFSHPADSPSGVIILGSGHYIGNWIGERLHFRGDGRVVIDFDGGSAGPVRNAENIYFKNWEGGLNVYTQNFDYKDCIFEPTPAVSAAVRMRGGSVRCLFIHLDESTTFSFNLNNTCNTRHSTFLGQVLSVAYSNGAFRFNFIPKGSLISVATSLNQAGFTDNMVNGLIRWNTTDYESKRLMDGSPRPDADPSIPDVINVIPEFYNQGNFSGDSKVIDFISRTCEPDSDLLKKSGPDGTIGGFRSGKKIALNEPNFLITYQNIDQSNPTLLRIANGFDFGKIRITGKVSDSLISSQKVNIRLPFMFAGSKAGNTLQNNNVPDSLHGLRSLDTLGDLPYRLRFEVRSSELPNANRNINEDWDNGVSGIPGRWYLMEYNQPMLHHVIAGIAYGNADKFAINSPTKVGFNYRSLDIEITLSNTRSYA